MEAGCFSWCPAPQQKKQKVHAKTKRKTKTERKRKPVQIVHSVNNTHREVVPSKLEYAADSGKQMIQVMEAAAGLIPVPYIKDAISVALKVVEACEDVTAIEQQVQELQDRVCQLMIVIIDSVTGDDESADSIYKAAKVIEDEVKALHRNLDDIVRELNDIKKQNRWLLFLFKDVNKSRVDGCMDRLTSAVERFNVAHNLRTSDVLTKIQTRLEKIHAMTLHVSEQVGNLHEKVDTGFSTILSTLKTALDQQESTTLVLRHQMPMRPRVFHGRDPLVYEIAQLLTDEKTSRVCILGPGGMGKTSIALVVMETQSVQKRFSAANRYWVPCIEATSPNLFLQILHSSLRIARNTENPLDGILNKLSASNEPRLILLDNFETPWNLTDGMQQQVERILCRLASLSHVALLVTMRGTYPPADDIIWQSRNLPPTDEEACRQIFTDINPRAKDDPDLGNLLKALGHMPFAVTLMARLAKETQASAGDLLDEWSRAGTDMISPSTTPEKSMNRSISLSVDSNLVTHDPDAFTLLATLSMLPAGTTRDRLNWWAPALKSKLAAIATLSKAALLSVNEGDGSGSPTLFVLPVVQSFMRMNNRIPEEVQRHVQQACCKYLLAHAARSGDSGFKSDAAALAAEDTNIQSVLSTSNAEHAKSSHSQDTSLFHDQGSIPSNEILDALLVFSWYRTDTKASVEIAKHTSMTAHACGTDRHIAEALFCLASTYKNVDKFDLANNAFEDAYTRFKELPPGHNSPRRTGECGLAWVDSMRYFQADVDDVVDFALEVYKHFESFSDEYGLACALLTVGNACWYAEEFELSLEYLLDAKQAMEKVGRQSDIAQCAHSLSATYYGLGKFPEALEAISEAMDMAEQVDDEYRLVDMIQFVAFVLVRLDRDDEALPYLERSSLAHQRLQGPLGIAQNFEHYGFIYLRRGEFQDATAAYQAVIDISAKLGPGSEMGKIYKRRSRLNIGNIKRKLENPDEKIGFVVPDACDGVNDTVVYFPPEHFR